MLEFSVITGEGWWYEHVSKVYSIDKDRDRFLIYNRDNEFEWVDFKDCKLVKED